MKIPIEGFSFKPTDPKRSHLIWRVYGARDVFTYPNGQVKPQPDTWELVTELRVKQTRARVTLPNFELEDTDTGPYRFYNLVLLDGEGREKWHDDNEMVLPASLPEDFGGRLDVAEWLLYNLELKGVIAPGQLND